MNTILIIDDNRDNLENLGEYLEIEGYKTLLADNGKAGLEYALKFLPDMIICDVSMPEIDGYHVLSHIRDMSVTSGIPFIFNTAISETIDPARAFELGADDYILKPYQPESILETIKKRIKTKGKSELAQCA
jgi:CheY-like chemotaxis protein